MPNFLTSIKTHVLIFKTAFTYIEAGKLSLLQNFLVLNIFWKVGTNCFSTKEVMAWCVEHII